MVLPTLHQGRDCIWRRVTLTACFESHPEKFREKKLTRTLIFLSVSTTLDFGGWSLLNRQASPITLMISSLTKPRKY